MTVAARVDEALRGLASRRIAEFQPELGRALVAETLDAVLDREAASAIRPLTKAERQTILDALKTPYRNRLAAEVLPDDVAELMRDISRRLVALGVFRDGRNSPKKRANLGEKAMEWAGDAIGFVAPTATEKIAQRIAAEHDRRLGERIKSLNWELFDRAVVEASTTVIEELSRLGRDRKLEARALKEEDRKSLLERLEKPFADRLLLWKKTKDDLIEEMSTSLQMPGWGNSFTQPIANRIEMLSTGVRLPVAAKVFGPDLDVIQRVSREVASALRSVRGAADVFPDQVIGKPYVEIRIDRAKAARYGINVGEVQDVVEAAIGGRTLTQTVEGRERYPVRIRYARDYRDDVEGLKNILVAAPAMPGEKGPPLQVPLAEVADVRVVEGPSMIKGENGLLRAYVQCRVRDRDEVGFVEEARRVVLEKVKLPAGVVIEWSGTFEHQARADRTLRIVFPSVIAVIALILYLTHKSWIDALLMMTSVLGALAGGAIFQWLFGFHFSVAVQVGYIACFGMAVETGVVMLVYLRESIADRGGLEGIGSIDELRAAILDGAVHRLRPKLLTEGAAIVSIAPMLWASGVGSEVIRPMAAPVLGGLLIADEVIDIFLPVLYFAVQRRVWKNRRGIDPQMTQKERR